MSAVPTRILHSLVDDGVEPLLLARVDRPDWPVALSNLAFRDLDGGTDATGQPFADVVERLVGREVALEVSETLRAGQASSIPVEIRGREFLLALQPVSGGSANSRYFAARWSAANARQLAPGAGETHEALVKANRRIRDLTRDDPTTGLLNEAAFREILQHDWAVAAREKSSLGLAAFGFDDFDAYFDVFGRHATDSCLRRVAQVIRRCLRRASDVAAWINGEPGGRIVVLSHGSDAENVRAFALRIAAAVRELGLHHPRSRISRFVTVSFEISMLQADEKGKSADKFLAELLKR